MRDTLSRLGAVAGFAAAAASHDERSSQPVSADEKAILDIMERWAATAMAGDTEGWLGLWDDEGMQYPAGEGTLDGKAALRKAQAGMKDLPRLGFKMHIDTQEVHVFSADGFAYARGVFDWDLMGPDGKPSHLDGRFLTILKKDPRGSWKAFRDCWNTVPPAP